MAKIDTEVTQEKRAIRIAWPRQDRINLVEWRIRDLTIRTGKYIDERAKWLLEGTAAGGRRFTLGDEVSDPQRSPKTGQ